jgi:hypothetical protein
MRQPLRRSCVSRSWMGSNCAPRTRMMHGSRNHEGRLASLMMIRDSTRKEWERRREALRSRRDELDQAQSRLIEAASALDAELARLHADWQAVASDLREVEYRLNGRTFQRVVDVEYVQEARPAAPSFSLDEVRETDLQIERLRLVLKDLAASRLRVTLSGLDVAGADCVEPDESFRRRHDTLRVIEQQIQGLAATLQGREEACPSSIAASERATSAIDELRRRVELTCQELSRQQSAQLSRQLDVERKSIDECEAQLLSHLDRLRRERERLLDGSPNPGRSRLVHTASFERRFCECAEHNSTTRDSSPPTMTRSVVVERVVEVSSERTGDRELRDRLLTEVGRHWHVWQQAMRNRNDLERELLVVETEREVPRHDAAIDELGSRLSSAQSELTAAQNSWQTLLTVEAALREVEQSWDSGRAGRILAEASGYFAAMSHGRYRGLSIQASTGDVFLLGQHPASQLDGDFDRAAFALRLALVEEYSRRGLDFPLILEDVLNETAEDDIRPVAVILSQLAANGRQIFILTDRETAVDVLEGAGASVYVMDGACRRRREWESAAVREPEAETNLSLESVQFAEAEPVGVSESTEPVHDSAETPAPASPTTLQGWDLSSPIETVPSIDIEAAVWLRKSGISTVGELLNLGIHPDPGLAEGRVSDVSTWRAEARLLLESPHLRGPDAQLLVACGVFTLRQLAEWECAGLHKRIQRFRGSAPPVWHVWIQKRQTWPREEDVRLWIEGARRVWQGAPPSNSNAETEHAPCDAAETKSASGRRRRKSRRGMSRGRGGSSPSERVRSIVQSAPKFHLDLESPIIDAPAIGPRTSRILQCAGVTTVAHLLARSPDELARCIGDAQIDAARIDDWQCQSRLMSQIAGLRGHDAQLLVGCGIRSTPAVASRSPAELLAIVTPFARSKAGQRILRSSSPPDLDDATAWIGAAADLSTRNAA